MISTENSYYYPDVGLSRQVNAVRKSGRSDDIRRGNDFLNNIAEASRRTAKTDAGDTAGSAGGPGNLSAQDEFSKNQEAVSELIGEATKADSKWSKEELLQVISEHREEILKKLKSGETGVKIPIGSLWLTEEEWEKLLDSFDEAQEKIQEAAREKSGEELPEKRTDTTINGNKVLAPEDTGHDLKSLEELASESDVRGALASGEAAQSAQKTAEEEKLKAWQTQREQQLQNAGVRRAEGFADCFPGMQVLTKTGDCTVSTGIWCRTDFPFWEYFREGTSADALNDWQPSGPQPSMLDPKIQRNLSSIGPGKISILIPEKLQAKMDADPAYAQEIYEKVAKWKEDYDAWDNATAAALGMNVAEHQLSKSYCVQLDEDGNVGNFTVVSGGGEMTQSEKTVEDNWLKRRNAAILFHRGHLAKMGYTGLTGTAGIVTQEGEDSPLSLLRAALAAETLLMDEDKKRK